jgi:manganese-dependent ADP-ribose/CDP-alcohol diphosphatase
MLGDILDGKSKALNMEEKCLSELLDLTTTTGCPWHYCIGNHDLVALSREKIYDALIPSELRTTCSPTRLYYDFCPHPGFRFVLLDGYDISTISATTKEHEQYAKILLSDNNPNLKDPHGDWLKGLSGPARRFVPFNGGVSQTQLDWLSSVLERAERAGERCFIFSHMPCHPGCCRTGGLIWNYEEVLSVLQKHSGTVVAVFSGHDHDGGYEIDETGIHHVVPAAPLECDEGELAYGHLAVYAHHCDVHWTGKTPASPPYRPWPSRLDYPPKKTT